MMLDDTKGNNLENRCGRQSTVGSNPTLSASSIFFKMVDREIIAEAVIQFLSFGGRKSNT